VPEAEEFAGFDQPAVEEPIRVSSS
jgi:hypothetical protein